MEQKSRWQITDRNFLWDSCLCGRLLYIIEIEIFGFFFSKKHIKKKVENSLKKIRNICLSPHPFLCRLLATSLLKQIVIFYSVFVCVRV